jgi:DNA-binding transcriptional LysR family regulator
MERMKSSEQQKGTIRFALPDSVCEDMILGSFVGFNKKFPHISLKVTNADTDDMFNMLDSNEVDAIITLDNHVYKREYVIAKEEPIEMCFVTNAKSSVARKKNITIEDISDKPFILTEKGMGYRRFFDRALEKRSIEITPILEIGRTDIITKLLIEKENVISYLPYFTVDKLLKSGELVKLEVRDMKTEIWKQLIYHKNKWLSGSMRVFLEYVKEHEFSKN